MDERLDVVGLGALNVDYIASASSLTTRMADRVTESAARFEGNVEGAATEDVILEVIDQLGSSSLQTALGGSAWNTIFALAQLRTNVKLGYIGVLGEVGMLGLSFTHQMDSLGIDRTWVKKLSHRPSGMCLSYIDDGERNLLTCPGANHETGPYLLEHCEAIAAYLASARFVHVTSLLDAQGPVGQLAVIARAKELNPALRVTFDPGHDWAMNPTAPILGILKLADYIFVNFREFKALGNYRHGQPDTVVALALLARCNRDATVFVTKRYDFVEVFHGEAARRFQLDMPAEPDTNLEDATGAGDIFSAAVLAALAARDLHVELGSLLGLSLARYKLQGVALPRLTGGFLQVRESLIRRRTRPGGVFIAHDQGSAHLEVREFLADDCGLSVYDLDLFDPTVPVADAMRTILARCGFAVCVLAAGSAMADGVSWTGQDIVHQAGIFHGRYGFGRVALLVERGCEVFSNVAGIIRLPFIPGRIDATFLEVERILIREGLLDRGVGS